MSFGTDLKATAEASSRRELTHDSAGPDLNSPSDNLIQFKIEKLLRQEVIPDILIRL
jgi:hypothetical protein